MTVARARRARAWWCIGALLFISRGAVLAPLCLALNWSPAPIQSAGGAGALGAHGLGAERVTQEPVSPTAGAAISTFEFHLLGLDVDLDEFLGRLAPALALAVRQQPVEPRADQHDDVGGFEHGRARRARALRMRVGQQALGHAHRQEGSAALFDQRADSSSAWA